jgi:hypothetical protein
MSRRPARTFLGLLRELLFDSRLHSQKARVERALLSNAQLLADIQYQATLIVFYNSYLCDLDPFGNWWEFADIKQKLHDHQELHLMLSKRMEESRAKLTAEKERYAALMGAGK